MKSSETFQRFRIRKCAWTLGASVYLVGAGNPVPWSSAHWKWRTTRDEGSGRNKESLRNHVLQKGLGMS